MKTHITLRPLLRAALIALPLLLFLATPVIAQSPNPQSGSVGVLGEVPTDPPTTPATITFPSNGQVFREVPITVSGLCTPDLLVKIFKNEVFTGSVVCQPNGTYEVEIDLFSGENELVARIFDSLDQPGPDSNKPIIVFNDIDDVSSAIDRVTITTNFAKRGAFPGKSLVWPFTLTGGTGPYAISIDWGDGNTTEIPLRLAGEFSGDHVYDTPGTYKIVVRATDSEGRIGFLQVVGVANGELAQFDPITGQPVAASTAGSGSSQYKVITWPLYIMIFLIVTTFWLGRRYEIHKLKRKLASQDPINY